MSTDDDLDLRLRRGLRAAAEAIPPPGLGGEPPAGQRRRGAGSAGRRLVLAGAAGVLAVAATAVGAASVGGDDDTADLQVAQATSTSGPAQGPAVDPVPGSAVVVGTELVSFGPDGQPGERLSLAPLVDVQAVTSDRHGGWIACGSTTPPDESHRPGGDDDAPTIGTAPTSTVPPSTAPTSTVPAGTAPTSTVPPGTAPTVTAAPTTTVVAPAGTDDGPTPTSTVPAGDAPTGTVEGAPATPNAYRFRSGEDPEPLPVDLMCVANSLGVTEIGGQDALVYVGGDVSLHQLDLATGTDSTMPLPTPSGSSQAAVGGGRLAMLGEAGLEVRDLATGEPVAIGAVELPVRAPDATEGLLTRDLVLSPDGTRLAALVGDISSTSDVVVVDVASGAELFRHEVPVSLEGAEVAFDGTTVAVGSYDDASGPVRIYDVATGTERTVDAHGLLP